MRKIAIYTALFGEYDKLWDPPEKYPGCDFVCFTDQHMIKSKVWTIRLVTSSNIDSIMMNRKYKMLPHFFLPDYDLSMYIDTNILLIKNPLLYIDKCLAHTNIAMPKHFKRSCIYQEAVAIIKENKANKYNVLRQITDYREQGFPENYGLTENNVIIRKHNEEDVVFLMNKWWEEVNKYTFRDQLSFMFLQWKYQIPLRVLKAMGRGRGFYWIKLHRKEVKKSYIGPLVNVMRERWINSPRLQLVLNRVGLTYICIKSKKIIKLGYAPDSHRYYI